MRLDQCGGSPVALKESKAMRKEEEEEEECVVILAQVGTHPRLEPNDAVVCQTGCGDPNPSGRGNLFLC